MKVEALALGFKHVESGPLVRSSYHARDQVPDGGQAPAQLAGRGARRERVSPSTADARVAPVARQPGRRDRNPSRNTSSPNAKSASASGPRARSAAHATGAARQVALERPLGALGLGRIESRPHATARPSGRGCRPGGGSSGDMSLSSGIRLGCAWVMARKDEEVRGPAPPSRRPRPRPGSARSASSRHGDRIEQRRLAREVRDTATSPRRPARCPDGAC